MSSVASPGPFTSLKNDLFDAVGDATSDVFLCSPFVTNGIATSLATRASGQPQVNWRLLTRLDAASVARKVLGLQGLRALLAAGVEIRSHCNLHAKAYLVDGTLGYVGSANLTYPGLGGYDAGQNLELSVRLLVEQCAEASELLETWWQTANPVTAEALEECQAAADTMATVFVPRTSAGAEMAATAAQLLTEADTCKVWVKAIYQDGPGVEWDGESFITSSKRGRPSFVIHDLMIIYVKDAKCCNAVVEVTGDTFVNDEWQLSLGIPADRIERWPFVTPVRARLTVPLADGVSLGHFGVSGRALQGGHRRLGTDDFAAALAGLTASSVQAGS